MDSIKHVEIDFHMLIVFIKWILCSEAAGRNANKVVLYEDAAKKKLQEFIAALRGCQSMVQACASFKETMKGMTSTLLQHNLTPGGGLPDVKPIMKRFETAFDWSEAEKTGWILPCKGVNKDYDLANQTVREIEVGFAKYLEMQQMLFGSDTTITYVTVGKEQYQIEIPESMLAKVPQDYEARSSRKVCSHLLVICPFLLEIIIAYNFKYIFFCTERHLMVGYKGKKVVMVLFA